MIEEVKAEITYNKQGLDRVDIILDEIVGFGKDYHYENIVNKKAINIIRQHLQILNAELTREFDKLVDNPEGYWEKLEK
jgi:dihydropteroate synthase|tara:strand:+ start:3081 stop:3317 length:237 start_codon:yes stop_codon:yes gene_type:complete